MLENLNLKELESHTLGELGVYSLCEKRVKELEEEASEFVFVALELLGIKITLCLLNLLEVVLRVISMD